MNNSTIRKILPGKFLWHTFSTLSVPMFNLYSNSIMIFCTFCPCRGFHLRYMWDSVAEWSKACDLKSLLLRRRRFESCHCRFYQSTPTSKEEETNKWRKRRIIRIGRRYNRYTQRKRDINSVTTRRQEKEGKEEEQQQQQTKRRRDGTS